MKNTSPYDKYFVPTYTRSGAPMVKGAGAWLYDADGKKYLDFCSGIAVTALGHGNPAIMAALKKQGSMLLHASNLFFMKPQIDLAILLIRHSFGERVFFCNSGTEAMEAAIKVARKWATLKDPKKYHILSFTECFHGRTFGGLSATAQQSFHAGFTPLVPGFHYSSFNDIAGTRAVLDKHAFAAVCVEPLQGESGFNAASTGFLRFLRDYTKKHGIALIFDEIQCGMGRTGTLWAHEQHRVTPDIMALAKPLGGGLPLGAIVCAEKFALAIKPGDHGTTFGGNPLACALGCVVLKTVARKSFLDGVKSKGACLALRLGAAVNGVESVTGLVGTGLMVGVRLRDDPKKVIADCRDNGLLLVKAGNNTIRFMPPLTVSKAEIDKAVAIFTRVMKKTA